MLSTVTASNSNADHSQDLLFSILDHAELGVVVVDASARPIYTNHSARNILDAPNGLLPGWVTPYVRQAIEALRGSEHQVARWKNDDDLVLRVRARPLDRASGLVVFEIRVAQGTVGRHVADQLARGLGLTISDGKLLALLWRGMSNDEIAQTLGVRVGTIKSRLFRLYQRLGVKRRPAAVLRAAEVLAA